MEGFLLLEGKASLFIHFMCRTIQAALCKTLAALQLVQIALQDMNQMSYIDHFYLNYHTRFISVSRNRGDSNNLLL